MKIRFLHMVENEWVDLQDPFQTQGTKSRMKCNYICLVPFSEAIFRVYSLSGSEKSTEKPFCFTSKPSRSLTAFSLLVPGGLDQSHRVQAKRVCMPQVASMELLL